MSSELDTDVTIAQIRAAANVLGQLASDCTSEHTHRDNISSMLALEGVLDCLADGMEESRRGSTTSENVIPIPEEAMTDEAMEMVMEHVHGMAEDTS